VNSVCVEKVIAQIPIDILDDVRAFCGPVDILNESIILGEDQ